MFRRGVQCARGGGARLAIAVALSGGGCHLGYTTEEPVRVTVTPIEPAPSTQACTPTPPRARLTGNTPVPEATGELQLLEVRGDDRMRVGGESRSALGPRGETQYMLTREDLLVWDAASGQLPASPSWQCTRWHRGGSCGASARARVEHGSSARPVAI